MTMQHPDDLVRADEEQRRRREADQARRAAGSSLYTARGWNPDAVAEERRTAERLGIAPILVEADPVGARQRAQSQADLLLLHDAPATARWISQSDNARLAHDQVEPLTLMERLARTTQRGGPSSAAAMYAPDGLGRGIADLGRRFVEGAGIGIGSTVRGVGTLMELAGQGNGNAGGQYLGNLTSRAGQRIATGGRNLGGTLTADEIAAYVAAGRDPLAASATDTGFAGEVASGLGQLVPQVALAVGAGGTLSLPSLFAQGAGQMDERVDQNRAPGTEGGADYTLSEGAAILGGGVVTAATERFGLAGILGRLPDPIQKRITNRFTDVLFAGLAEGSSEALEGIGQNALASALLGEETGLLDGTIEEGSVATVVGSLARALALTAIPGRQYVERQNKAREDATRLQSFNELGDRVLENPLFARAPDRMEAFLQSINPESTVHLPAEVVATFFQSNPDLAGWLDEWDIRDQLEQASAGGAEIVMPASVYLTRVRPTEAHEAFKADMRLGFDDLSANEIAAEAEQGEARLEAAMTEAETVADQAEAEAAPFDRVVADAFSQLRAAGRSIEVAQREALVEGVRARTRAARSPDAFPDAWAAYQAEPLTVRLAPTAQRARVNMDRADVFIAALRAGRGVDRQARMAGPSLMEFVAQEGGIADTGGELAAMGADEWHKGRAFRRRLVRDGDEGTYGSDYVTERAIAAGYLPEGATGNDLLEAFREELAGRPRFSSMADRNLTAEENEAALQDFEAMLAELGLNAKVDSAEDIKAALEAASAEPMVEPTTDADGVIYDQSGALVTDSPAFRAWFSDSKVVDENGEPLVVYRGLAGHYPRRGEWLDGRLGVQFWTPDAEAASDYAWSPAGLGDNIVPAFLSIQRPADLTTDQGARAVALALGVEWSPATPYWELLDHDGAVEKLSAAGFDGAILADSTGYAGHQSFVTFRPEQIKSVFNRGTFDPADPRILYQSDVAPPFYSALAAAVSASQTKRAPADQWKATLAKTPGVKKEEIEWSGVNDWLDMQTGPVAREALAEFLAGNGVRVDEVVRGGGVVTQAELEAETEAVLDMWAAEQDFDEWDDGRDGAEVEAEWRSDMRVEAERQAETEIERRAPETQFSDWKLPGADDTYREVLLTLPGLPGPSTHWDTENVVAHARLTERVDADGRKVLFIEEVQSDWHQKGRDQGYRQPVSPAVLAEAERAFDAAVDARDKAALPLQPVVLAMVEARIERIREKIARRSNDWDLTNLEGSLKAQKQTRDALEAAIEDGRLWTGTTDLLRSTSAGDEDVLGASAFGDQIAEHRALTLRATEAYAAVKDARGEKGIPDAPFRTSWPALVMKRMIRYAVDVGAERIAWTTGEQQAERYSLSEAVGGITAERLPGGEYEVTTDSSQAAGIIRDNGMARASDRGFDSLVMTAEQMRQAFGGNIADQLLAGADPLADQWAEADRMENEITLAELDGDDARVAQLRARAGELSETVPTRRFFRVEGEENLRVGGEGMRAFYDRNLVNITNDIIKRYGAKVGPIDMMSAEDRATLAGAQAQLDRLNAIPEAEQGMMHSVGVGHAQANIAMVTGDAKALKSQPGFQITDAMREAAGRGFTLFQGMTGPRGSIQPGDSHLITLMATADKSTFLHEAGHRYLFGLFNDAARPGASEQIKADARAVLAWMNVNDSAEVTRELHEKWAETFEQYLMEGRAPSVELRGAFQRFSAWLKAIYDGVRRRLPNAAINDDIRGVMDRLLATDAEIEEARTASGVGQGIASAELAGMTPEAFAEYAALANRARDEAQDTLLRETMRAIRREKTAEWKALAAEFRPDIEAEIDGMLDMQAVAFLRRNPMSRELAVAMLGNEAGLALLPKSVPPLVALNGVHPDMAAEAAGYPSGMAMLNGLMEYQAELQQRRAEGLKGSMREGRIEERVREKMLEHYGDPFTDGSIEEEALAAIHNDTQGKVLAAELGILARRSGSAPSPYSVLRQWAARHIGSRPITEAKPQRFLRAERTAAANAIRALTAKNNAEAFRQKQAQTVNFLLYSEARKAKRDVEKAIARMARLGRKRTVKSMDQDYLDQIHDLLRQYDLTSVPAAEVQARASLLAWVNERDENGELVRPNVQIPSRLLEKAKLQHYSTLTVDEVRELDDAVQHLAKLGRLKKELIAGRERRELDDAAREARETGEKNLPVKPAREGMAAEETLAAKIINFLPNAEASLVRIQDYFRRLQGGDTGVFTDVLDKPGQAAAAKMIALRRAFWEPIRAAERLIPDEVKVRWSERLDGHPLINPDTGERLGDMIRQDLIGMAKHVGSASNFEKFAKGWGFVPKNADEFAVETARRAFVVWLDGQLHPTEWDYVQAWWDAHEGQREEYFDNERELTGIRPIPVEAAPVMIAGRTLPGGYAPISYDGRFDKAAAARDLADENDIFGGVTRVARTSNGAAQDRSGYVGPVNFGMRRAGADAHTQMVRIAYGKYVSDALKFLGHPDVQSVIKTRLGFEVIGHLNAWVAGQVKDQAIPEQATRQLDGLIRGARANMMVGMMLLSSTVLMAQIGGLVQSTRTVGPKVVARGFALASSMAMRKGPLAPFRYVMEQSSYMRSRVEEASFDRDIRGAALQPASTATIGMLVAGKKVSAKRRAAVALQLATAARNNLAGAGGWLIGAVDLMLVSGPTWLGAYDMALTKGMSEADAIHFADSKVIQAQGGGRPIDTAPVMRGSEAVKTFTLAYGWASASYNLQREDVLNLRDGKDRSKAMVGLMGMFFAQPLIDALLSNDWPDWEDPQDIFAWFMRNVMFGIPNGIPGVRDIAGQLERKAAGKFAGDIGGTAMGRIFTTFAQLGDDLYRGAVDTALIEAGFEVEDKEVSRRWPAHILQALGYGFGIAGTVQASRIVSYTTDVADGEQNPAHMGDVLNGLARGPQDDQK